MGGRDGRRKAALGSAAAPEPCRAIVWRTAPALARNAAHEMEEIVTQLRGRTK